MPKKREPIDLIIAKGKKHLTKAEIAKRKETELKVPTGDIEPPEFLNKKQAAEFLEIAKKLIKLNIFTELDVDCLAQYVASKDLYVKYTKQVNVIANKAKTVHKWAVIDRLAGVCDDGDVEDLKELLEKIIRRQRGDDLTVMMNLQDKAFRQCQACARELGMTITSRCKITIPPPPDEDDEL